MSTAEMKKLADKIDELIVIADRDYADDVSNAAATGERPDLWDREIDVPVDLLRSVLAALRAALTASAAGPTPGIRDNLTTKGE